MLKWSLRAAAGQPAGDSQLVRVIKQNSLSWRDRQSSEYRPGAGLDWRVTILLIVLRYHLSSLISPLRSGLQSQISLEICPHSFSSVRYGDSS